MKGSRNMDSKVIVYDDVCPLCKAYTGGFVQMGWLRPENRIGFAEARADLIECIDVDRARHEIPLYDKVSGETLYGKEALFFIIGEAIPVFRPLFRLPLFRALIFVLYQIITYNRRIIANSRPPSNGFDCAPDFSAFYRWTYIGLMGLFTGLLVTQTAASFDWSISVSACLAGIAILRGCLIRNFRAQTDYYGHLATVLFIVALLYSFLQNVPVALPTITLFGAWLFYQRMR